MMKFIDVTLRDGGHQHGFNWPLEFVERYLDSINTFQEIEGYVSFYPNDYFCPKSYKTGNIELTQNSYCIHHFAKSWIPYSKRWRNILKMKVMFFFGAKNIQKLIDILKK